MRLVDSVSHSLVDEYRADKTITVARSNLSQLVVSLSGGTLLYFEVDSQRKKLVLVTEKQLDQDVACVSMKIKSPNADSETMDVDTDSEKETVIAVGMWTDNTVRLLALPSFDEVNRTVLGTETQARDILLASFESSHYLFVGMGDGHLITYNVDFNTGGLPMLSNKRNGVIGTQPLAFSWFVHNSDLCIFACCDRPTIIYLRNKKILFSLVDSRNKQITTMTSFHTELFPDCIALCSETELVIGIVEDIQKLHVQTIPLGEAPRRIAHCASLRAYCVATEQVVQGEHGEESVSRVLFFDDSSMSLITAFKLELLEQALAVIACKLDDKFYFAVGTAQIVNEEIEPSKGRVLIFEVNEDRKSVTIVAERETKSGVYTLANVCDKLAAGIASKVQIYKLVSKDQGLVSNFGIQPELQSECSHQGHVLVLFLKSHGDFLLVGDMLRSMTVLQYKATENIIEEAARDFSVHMLRAVEIMDGFDDLYIGCEDFANLFTLKRRADATSDEERSRLESHGYFHLGDYVNTMRRGTLINQPIENDAMQTNETIAKTTIFDINYRSVTGYSSDHPHSVIYGTISGAIGSIIALTEPSYQFFSAVEKALRAVINQIGGLVHQDWRSFKSEIKIAPQKNVLDGDLIETVMDLSRADLELVAKEVNNILTTIASTAAPDNVTTESVNTLISNLASQRSPLTPEDLLQRVEDISRLH
ncbi:hypothetical protein EON65_06255 [archaeon]|nr:MAG: hypothetical protein EON65_06255 [archaeon]